MEKSEICNIKSTTNKISLPPMYDVVFYNDDVTTMEFVVELLMVEYGKSQSEAEGIMLSVHHNGQGVAGTYFYDIALSKAQISTNKARANGFPLKINVVKK